MEGDVGSDWKEREWNKKMGGGNGSERKKEEGTGRGDWTERDRAGIVNHMGRGRGRDRVERRRRSCEGCGERLRNG